MMIFNLEELTLREIKALRKSLDYIPITGIDAAFIAILQNKINTQIQQIESHLQSEETNKGSQLQEAISNDPKSKTKTTRGKKST